MVLLRPLKGEHHLRILSVYRWSLILLLALAQTPRASRILRTWKALQQGCNNRISLGQISLWGRGDHLQSYTVA